MKRIIAFVIALLLMLTFCACGDSENEEVTVNIEAGETNGDGGSEELSANSKQGETNIVGDSLVLVRSGDTQEKPYKKFLWSERWDGYGWLSADGESLAFVFPELEGKIPEIHYCDDFEILYGENVSYNSLSVYGEDYEIIHRSASQGVLESLQEGTYYLAISVKVQGKYIEEEKQHEASGYECVYKLVVDGEALE